MKNLTVINDDIYRITMPYKDIFTTVFIIKTPDGAVLFDTASYDEDVPEYIIPFLKETGVSAEILKYIFISHNHRDHAGGLAAIVNEYPDVTIVSRCPNLKASYESHSFIMPEDNAVLLGVLKIVTIPGHTSDSMALLDTRTNTLITGDCMQLYGIFGSQDWGSNIGFPVEHIEAIKKVRAMDIDNIYMAHDYYPIGTQSCGKDEVSKALDACVEPIYKVRDIICNNPQKDDQEVRLIYNTSGHIPPISTRLVTAVRTALSEGRMA